MTIYDNNTANNTIILLINYTKQKKCNTLIVCNGCNIISIVAFVLLLIIHITVISILLLQTTITITLALTLAILLLVFVGFITMVMVL